MGVLGEKGAESLSEQIMAQNSPNLRHGHTYLRKRPNELQAR